MHLTALALAALTVAATPAVDFDTQVIPVLTKAGCNSGACHGASGGQGSFSLSLWGSNPDADYDQIVRERGGRRFSRLDPPASLVLAKPTGMLDHGGGVRIEWDSPEQVILRDWLVQGGRRLRSRRLAGLRMVPEVLQVSSQAHGGLVRAIATFDDGREQDVSRFAVFTPRDEGSLDIAWSDPNGVSITPRRPGAFEISVRFLDRLETVEVVLPVRAGALPPPDTADLDFIDQLLADRQYSLGLSPLPMTNDAVWLRRASLLLLGRLPTVAELHDFSASTSAGKFADKIDEFFLSKEFADRWTLYFSQLLSVDSQVAGPGANVWANWIREQVAANRPLDEFARELITANGDPHEVGPANFQLAAASPDLQGELFAQVFLGVRIQCANCHAHPFDRWTQDDYHGLAAIFAKVETLPLVRFKPDGFVIHPKTGRGAVAKIPGGDTIPSTGDPRVRLADWLSQDDNPFFARSIVNRLWKEAFGKGLVEPVGDLRNTHRGIHAKLLDRLAADFVEHDFDLRHLLRRILLSRAFRRENLDRASALPAETVYDQTAPRIKLLLGECFAGYQSHPLPAEVLLDAYSDVTGVSSQFEGVRPGSRAIELFDQAIQDPSLRLLGRCRRAANCTRSETNTSSLERELLLLNGDLLNAKISDQRGRLPELIRSPRSTEEVVRELFLICFSRQASEQELDFWRTQLGHKDADKIDPATWEDCLWALLNSEEFSSIH